MQVPTYMDIDSIQLRLGTLQLSDSFFPTGAYATSNGLESLFTSKLIHSSNDITKVIKVCITQQAGPSDCIVLSNTYDQIIKGNLDEIIHIDNLSFAAKSIKEIRDASTRSGIQLVRCMREFVKDDPLLNHYQDNIVKNSAHGIFPVAFALSCNSIKINKEESATMMLYGFTVSMVGAALRLGLIQHFEGQTIIHDLKPAISKTIHENIDRPISEMWQFAPQMEIVQMSHEQMDSKMFIT